MKEGRGTKEERGRLPVQGRRDLWAVTQGREQEGVRQAGQRYLGEGAEQVEQRVREEGVVGEEGRG